MKKKQKVDFTIAIILILIGICLLLIPLLKLTNIKITFISIMSLYSLLNLIQFVLTRKSKDYEGLYTMCASIIVLIVSIILKVGNSELSLALSLMIWVILMSITKLIKTDYYEDRNDKMWKLKVLTLILFIITGLLTSINLYYEPQVQTLIIGFFFFIHGILEIIDPMVKYLLQRKS